MRDFGPHYMAACFDVGKKTHRQEKYAEYKIQRQAMPEDLRSQILVIRDILKAYHIPIFDKEGYEADDVIATLASRLSTKKVEVVIVSDDKDLSQLMNQHIHLYSPRQERMLTGQDIEEKFGVPSSSIVDLIALAGDASDNIPGVEGIGQVSAVKLLKAYGSLEKIYQHLDEITPSSLQEKLKVGQKQAKLSQELALVDVHVPIEATLEDLKLQPPNQKRLYEIFSELEFRKFAQELTDESTAPPALVEENSSKKFDSVEIKDEGQKVTVVYDLKSLRKKSRQPLKGKVFDIFLGQYLLAGGLHRAEARPLLSQKDFQQLYQELKKEIHQQKLDFLFYDVEMPLADILYEMEENGVQLDVQVLKELSSDCTKKINEVQNSLFKITGFEFNVNSPKQLSEVLFERLKLPVVKKIKTGFSTNEEVLTKLAAQHPLPALILEYRQIAKLQSTYIDALPKMVDAQSRLHASFNQTGTETGRLSSNNPNLQNIPVRTDLGRQVRKAFVSYGKGHVLLSADYSQIELRLLAHSCEDENLSKVFKTDGDVHRYTASLIFEVSEQKVDESMRQAAKRINFGIIYGMSAFGLAKDLNISQGQARDFIDRYFLVYGKVKEYLDDIILLARANGYVETYFGRRRYIPDLYAQSFQIRQAAERAALNMPIQGTNADIVKLAMSSVYEYLKREFHIDTCKFVKKDVRMLLQVHDELVFEIKEELVSDVIKELKKKMEHVVTLAVRLVVDISVGPNWADLEKIES